MLIQTAHVLIQTAQVLENIVIYPWATNRAGAPVWAAAKPDVLKELIRCDVFEWDQHADLSLADVYAALKVLDNISSEQTLQVEQLLQRQDKGGVAKSTREMTTAWRALLVETLRATYSIAAVGIGMLDDVKKNVEMKVTEHMAGTSTWHPKQPSRSTLSPATWRSPPSRKGAPK